MSNYCYNYFTFYSKDKSVLEDLDAKLSAWMEQPTLCPASWNGNNKYLGNLLLHAGFTHKEIYEDNPYIYCRGTFEDFQSSVEEDERGFYTYSFSTETVWRPAARMWKLILDKLYPGNDVKIAYSSELLDCDGFWKWDPENLFYAGEEVYVEIYADNPETIKANIPQLANFAFEDADRYYTKADAVKLLQSLTGSEETDLSKLEEVFNDEIVSLADELDESLCLNVCEYEICSPEEIEIL